VTGDVFERDVIALAETVLTLVGVEVDVQLDPETVQLEGTIP
jgi:hypothetical protein